MKRRCILCLMAPKSSPASDSNVTNAFFEIAKLMTKKLEKTYISSFFSFSMPSQVLAP